LLEDSPLRPSTAPLSESSPPRSRVASLPSGVRIISASLEATPRRKGQTALPLPRPPHGGIKFQPPLHSARVRRRQAAIPHSGCDRSPVRQLWSLLLHSGRYGDTVRTCDAVQDVLGTAPATVLPTPHTSFKLSIRRALEWRGHDPRKPLWPRPGQDPGLQDPRNVATPRLKDGTPYNNDHAACWSYRDTGMISARPRTTATPGTIPHSVLSTVLDHCTPAIRGEDNDFHDFLCMYTAPPCAYKKRRRAFP